MATAVDFAGSNMRFTAPPGREEDVGTLHAFANGTCIVSSWELSDAEIEEVLRTRRVFLSSMSGQTLFPIFVGSESVVRGVVVDYGAVWPRESEGSNDG